MTVIDVSNWQIQFATPEAARQLAAAGVDRAIVGCQRSSIAREHVHYFREAGIVVEDLYAFLYFGFTNGVTGEVEKALEVARRMGGIKRIWLDCEATGEHLHSSSTIASRHAELREAVKMVEDAGFAPGIYTGGWWWPPYMNTEAFSHLPLWHSEYWADWRAVPVVSYGGWSKVAIHQYTSTRVLLGANVDHNYWYIEEADMPDDRLRVEIEELNAAVMKRMDLIRLASGDYAGVKEAWKVLKERALL